MMKKYILLIVMLTAAISCSRVEDLMKGDSDKVNIVINGREGDDNTRSIVEINPEATASVTFNFENDDLLGVFPNGNNDKYSQQLKLKANVNGSQFSGTTVGWLLNSDITYAAYYPFNADYHQRPDNIVFSYKGQTQTGNGNADENLAHLSGYTFLYSEPVSPEDNSATFVMNNASAFLHIRHYSEKGGTFSAMTISTDDGSEAIPTEIKASLFSKTITNQGFTNSITISLDEYSAAERQNLNVWCALPPVDLNKKKLRFTFIGKEGTGTENTFFTMKGKNLTASWEIYNFVEHIYALKYHANADDASFAGGAKDYNDIKVAEGKSCDFAVIGENGDEGLSFPGHELIGWATIEDGEAEYSPASNCHLENENFDTSDMSMDMYAVWNTLDDVTVSGVADPTDGGVVHIDGEPVSSKDVAPGTQVSLQAIPNQGYKFSKWSDGWSDATRVETINEDATYTAEFTKLIVVNVSSENLSKGSVSGGGPYSPNADVTITATPTDGYEFEKWESESGDVITQNPYKFTAEADISFTAYFKEKGSDIPEGALPGVFTVNGKKIRFSKGNLQYQPSTGTWRFAEHQYDYVGMSTDDLSLKGNMGEDNDNTKITTDNYLGWMDLFGWGTSGYQEDGINKRKCYLPTSTSSTASDYWINGDYTKSLSRDEKTDWGVNISGADWRTPTSDEWQGLIARENGWASCHLTINDNDGENTLLNGQYVIFIFPDDWDNPDNIYSGPYNNEIKSTSTNDVTLSLNQFNKLQNSGVVLLPPSFERYSNNFNIPNLGTNNGHYWSATSSDIKGNNSNYAHFVCIRNNPNYYTFRYDVSTSEGKKYYGKAVRLITDVK